VSDAVKDGVGYNGFCAKVLVPTAYVNLRAEND